MRSSRKTSWYALANKNNKYVYSPPTVALVNDIICAFSILQIQKNVMNTCSLLLYDITFCSYELLKARFIAA